MRHPESRTESEARGELAAAEESSTAPQGSLSESLAVLEPSLVGALVSVDAWARLRKIGDLLPSTFAGLIGFEVRLEANAPQTDLLLGVASKSARGALAREEFIPPNAAAAAAWRRIGAFCRAWQEGAQERYAEVQTLWLELDAPGDQDDVPVPSVFVGALPQRETPGLHERWRPRYLGLARSALALLSGRELAPPIDALLAACVECLPHDATVFQTGTMLSRPGTPVRIEIRGLAGAELGRYLARVGCSADLGELERIARELARWSERVDLALDVGEEIGTHIGLVCPFDPPGAPRSKARPAELLAHLVDVGLCTEQKRSAFLDFAGVSSPSDGVPWPRHLRDSSSFLSGRYRSLISRQLGQIKVTHTLGGTTRAKGYLGVQEVWAPVPAPRAAWS